MISAAAAGDHARQQPAGEADHRPDVQRHLRRFSPHRLLDEWAIAPQPGVVDQHPHVAERGGGAVHRLHPLWRGEVSATKTSACPPRRVISGGHVLKLCLLSGNEQHRMTLFGKVVSKRATDAARRACDHCPLSSTVHCHDSLVFGFGCRFQPPATPGPLPAVRCSRRPRRRGPPPGAAACRDRGHQPGQQRGADQAADDHQGQRRVQRRALERQRDEAADGGERGEQRPGRSGPRRPAAMASSSAIALRAQLVGEVDQQDRVLHLDARSAR